MYPVNTTHKKNIEAEDRIIKAKIDISDSLSLDNVNVSSIKYEIDINPDEKLSIGGAYAATITLTLLNYKKEFEGIDLEHKELKIWLKVGSDILTVTQINRMLVGILDKEKVGRNATVWVPIGVYVVDKIKENENNTITVNLIDKMIYMDTIYVSNLIFPTSLANVWKEACLKKGVYKNNIHFLNEETVVDFAPENITFKQLFAFIAECAGGFAILDRIGELDIVTFKKEIVKTIENGTYFDFPRSENEIIIKKIKCGEIEIGEDVGHVLELDTENPFLKLDCIKGIYNLIKDVSIMPCSLKIRGDFAFDPADRLEIIDRSNKHYSIYIMLLKWEFNGSFVQNITTKGETTINNTYASKGPIRETIDKIKNELIPNTLQQAIEAATDLITQFNGGFVVKKSGELYISDNEDIDKAKRVWRWNLAGLGYSGNGIKGPYQVAITMDGSINASFITSGSLTANLIKGGVLKIGGINNIDGNIQVVDSEGKDLVTIDVRGIVMANGTKLIGGNGVLSNFKFDTGDWKEVGFSSMYNDVSYKLNRKIAVYIPSNFEVVSAYITLYHSARYITKLPNIGNSWCYSRNIRLYKIPDIDNYYIVGNWASGATLREASYTEVLKAFGEEGFTGTCPKGTPEVDTVAVSSVTSIDIKDYINIGKYSYFKIESGDFAPSVDEETYTHTGLCTATLNVVGYMKG